MKRQQFAVKSAGVFYAVAHSAELFDLALFLLCFMHKIGDVWYNIA